MDESILTDPPRPEEIEVSVFGPGVGESIVIHIGDGEWIVIDSCIDSETRTAVALSYLSRVGVDAAAQVTAVIATHWDSDHIRGLAKVVEKCTSAEFWCSASIDSDEFEALLDLAGSRPNVIGPRLKELGSIIAERRDRLGDGPGSPQLLMEASLVLERHQKRRLPRRAVHALSPSTKSLLYAFENVRYVLRDADDVPRRVQELDRNDASVALIVEFGKHGVLLGGDLEATSDVHRGWIPAVKRARHLGVVSSLVKIPHHGSADYHAPEMWQSALTPQPAAALTPFVCGEHPLPRPRDCERIRALTPHAYLTSQKVSASCRATLAEIAPIPGAEITVIQGRAGHVRWRRMLDGSDDWRIALDSCAQAL
jgi:hypothetical protein